MVRQGNRRRLLIGDSIGSVSPTLIIAEKLSAARDIAKALDIPSKDRNSFENDEYIITAANGHLNEIYNPQEETVDHKNVKGFVKWSAASLPVLPEEFALRPQKEAGPRVNQIKHLAKRADTIINACDAAREGELIFHYIQSYLGFTQPIKRLWLQSMTKKSIVAAFDSLREHEELAAFRDAAVARSEADWLVGINATRALTVRNSREGGFQLTNVGRVQTPTLALLVERERQRRAHVPRPYWELSATFAAAAGPYIAQWVAADRTSERARVWEEPESERIVKMLQAEGAVGVATDESKERNVSAPPLFDLNTLQREANRSHGFSARMTLSAAQALYERHKALTYPRTESRFLPNDYVGECQTALRGIASSEMFPGLGQLARGAIDAVATVGKKVFDDSKVTDHFAIIPTGILPEMEKLKEIEVKVYEMVCRRFVSTFMPPAKLRETVRITMVGDDRFEAKGRVLVSPGWYAAGRPHQSDVELPELAGESEEVKATEASSASKITQPPGRYDEAALLGAMQKAAKFVEEDKLSEMLTAVGGIGTPATRAGIIEELIARKYVSRNRRELVPSSRSERLIEILEDMDINALVSPEMTGDWEQRLRAIEDGKESKEKFLSDIRELAGKVCRQAFEYDPDNNKEVDYLKAPCPKCNGKVAILYNKYGCRECNEYFMWNVIGKRPLSPSEAELLIKEGEIGPFADFLDRFGNEFSAKISVDETGKPSLVFFDSRDDEFTNLDELEQVGRCPVKDCTGRVFAAESQFRCANAISLEGATPTCTFKLGRMICKRELGLDEARDLLRNNKTELLADFKSKRTGRPFKAHLLLDNKGKLGFEFEARAERGARKTAKPRAAKPRSAKSRRTARSDDDRPHTDRYDGHRPTSGRPARSARPPSDRHSKDRPRSDRSGPSRHSSDKPRSGRPRPDRSDGGGPQPSRSDGNRPRPSRFSKDRPRSDRSGPSRYDSDRPRSGHPRPARSGGDGPQSSKSDGDRPRPFRYNKDRPRSDRSGSSRYGSDRPRSGRPRPDRSGGGRPHSSRPDGDGPRPSRFGDDRSRSDRPRPSRFSDDRSRSDRPRPSRFSDDRSRSDRPRPSRFSDDRSRSDRPRPSRFSDDRSRSDRPRPSRYSKDRFRSDRSGPSRHSSDRPRSDWSGASRFSKGHPRSDRSGGGKPRSARFSSARARSDGPGDDRPRSGSFGFDRPRSARYGPSRQGHRKKTGEID